MYTNTDFLFNFLRLNTEITEQCMGIHKKHVLERLSKEEWAHHRYLEFFIHFLECVVT